MKKLSLLLLTLLPISAIQAGEPSAMFGQELASISKPDEINLDVYSLAPNNYIRVGLDNGEVMVDYTMIDADLADTLELPHNGQSLSYKWFINDSLALYGGLGINAGVTDEVIIGAAYTINTDNIRFNINPVMNAGDGTQQSDVYLGAFMKFDGLKDKEMMFGAQFHSDITAGTNAATVGLRWLARKNVTIDLALFNTDLVEFPGVFAINIAF